MRHVIRRFEYRLAAAIKDVIINPDVRWRSVYGAVRVPPNHRVEAVVTRTLEAVETVVINL